MIDTIINFINKAKSPDRILFLLNKLENQFLQFLRDKAPLFEEEFGINDLSTTINKVEKIVNQALLKCNEPLRVALIGDYSSGKTTTLSALFRSIPELKALPRELERPTTGNVLELKVNFDETSTTNNDTLEGTLFSKKELEEIIQDYYTEISKITLVKKALPTIQGDSLRQIDSLVDSLARFLIKIDTPEIKHNIPSSTGPALRDFYELVKTISLFKNKYSPDLSVLDNNTLNTLLFPKNHEKFSLILENLITLKKTYGFSELDTQLRRLWSMAPASFDTFHQNCRNGNIKTEALRAIFLLLKRVTLPISVPGINNLKSIKTISFMDFPGLGSTNFRDKLLSKKEVRSAHANLLFIHSGRLESGEIPNLYDIIRDEKKELVNERILPVFSFFDAYQGVPEYTGQEENTGIEDKKKRVNSFFRNKKYDEGFIERGFFHFEEKLAEYDLLKPRLAYFLISAIASIDDQELNPKELGFKNNYRTILFDNYREFVKDLKAVEKTYEKNKRTSIFKLQIALQNYVSENKDGGIGHLRGSLIRLLNQRGVKMITQDAASYAKPAFQIIEEEIISPLKEEILEEEVSEETLNKVKKEKIIAQWASMKSLVEYWLERRSTIELKIKTPSTGKSFGQDQENHYHSILENSWDYILDKVVSLPFWEKTKTDEFEQKRIPLRELIEPYRELESETQYWYFEISKQAILDTLEKIEQERFEWYNIQEGALTSLADKLDFFEALRVDLMAGIPSKTREEFKSLISIKTLDKYIYHEIKGNYDELGLNVKQLNKKVPFDEYGHINCTAIEVMKLQRQMAITLQDKISELNSFFNITFNQVIKSALKIRLGIKEPHPLINSFTMFPEDHSIFNYLSDVEIDQEEGEEDPFQRRLQAEEEAKEMLLLWENFLNQ